MKNKDTVSYEFESRAMIDEVTYQKMLTIYCKEKCKHLKITNIYFDYVNKSLSRSHIVLRVRNINDKFDELTLKIKEEKGDIEVTHQLTSTEKNNLLNNIVFPSCKVKEELLKRKVDLTKLKIVAILKTDRLEIEYEDHLFVLDKNHYNGITDYNVEVESTSRNAAKKWLIKYISPFGIEYKKDYISKSRRALNSAK